MKKICIYGKKTVILQRETIKLLEIMSATQALVGERIAMAMGSMTPLITQAELDRDCMPLGTAMDKLRQKAQNYFFAAK